MVSLILLPHRKICTGKTNYIFNRDSEDSAPAEYPPDQPEADTLDDDGTAYGAEEAEMQAALEQELEETEAKMNKPAEPATAINGTASDDKEMIDPDKSKDEDEASEAGSEDLEEESSDEDDEDEEDEEGPEGEDTEMADGEEKSANATTAKTNGQHKATESKAPIVAL